MHLLKLVHVASCRMTQLLSGQQQFLIVMSFKKKKNQAQSLVFRFSLRTEVRECGIYAAAPSSLHGCVLASAELLAPASKLRNQEILFKGNGV